MEASDIFAEQIDKSQIPPLHQKRIVAFINHFLLSSCKFLNEFAGQCDARFIAVERKMQRLEVALNILEAKLASIPDFHNKVKDTEILANRSNENAIDKSSACELAKSKRERETNETTTESIHSNIEVAVSGVKACEDRRYKKFFKMIQFGVPMEAVKIKMQTEGLPPDILDTPDLLLTHDVSA